MASNVTEADFKVWCTKVLRAAQLLNSIPPDETPNELNQNQQHAANAAHLNPLVLSQYPLNAVT